MKKFRKIMAVVAAMAMTVAMSFGAIAATNGKSVDTSATSTHTFTAYEILKGTQADDSAELAVKDWGDALDAESFLGKIKSIADGDKTPFAKVTDAKSFAEALSAYKDGTAVAKAVAKAADESIKSDATGKVVKSGDTDLDAGYYLIKDTTKNLSGNDAINLSLLYQPKHGTVTIQSKADVPTVEKKVKEKNDTTGDETGWQDAADYDIGDEIPYQITGSLPSTFADYTTYTTYTFTDTLSDGLTITNDEKEAITVKVGDESVKDHFVIAVDGQVLTISLKKGEDLKTWTSPALTADSKIVVEYKATLDEDAKIGSEGNPNTVDLTYSNNPNAGGEGDTGKTPDDKVTVFTYEIKALKIHATSDAAITEEAYNALSDAEKADYIKIGDTYQKTEALEGAGFTLYKKDKDGNFKAVGSEIVGDNINDVRVKTLGKKTSLVTVL